MFEKTDQQLIDKALHGDNRAWLKLVKRHQTSLYNYAWRMLGNPDDALDLMQEVFVSVFRNLPSYREEGTFKAWLFKIAHHRCVEFYRRKRPLVDLNEVPEAADPSAAADVHIATSQHNQQLIHAMQQLPINQKAVVELKFFGQFTFDEIAQQLDISANTAKSRLYSALEKLKVSLEIEHAVNQ